MSLSPLLAFPEVFHHAPLHFLPAIAGSARLMSKDRLLRAGFDDKHFRTTSKKQDLARGFAHFVHLTTSSRPRILNAKLKRGFPHLSLILPISTIAALPYALCRYNIAKTRLLRRDGKPGAQPSATNGRYYGEGQVPIARTVEDQQAMIDQHVPIGTMLEVLVTDEVTLPPETRVRVYHAQDCKLVESLLGRANVGWSLEVDETKTYDRSAQHAADVEQYIQIALGSASWRAPELEFDDL